MLYAKILYILINAYLLYFLITMNLDGPISEKYADDYKSKYDSYKQILESCIFQSA